LLVYPRDDFDNEVARLRHVEQIGAVAFSPNGRRLVTQSKRSNPYHLNEENDFPLRSGYCSPKTL
jgi:hypothetical protein